MSSLPSKLFFRIGEVAGLVGVEPHVLRYWEREFRSIRPTKSAKGQRVYSRKDVENLLRVRDLLYRDGFTIAGAKKKLQTSPATGTARGSGLHERMRREPAPEREPVRESESERDSEPERESEPEQEGESATEMSDEVPVTSSLPPSAVHEVGAQSRTKLVALRAEVEAFLDELETHDPSDADA